MLKTRQNLLPEDQRKVFEAKQKADNQKESRLRADMNEVFATGAGMNVLRFLMDQAAVFQNDIVITPQTWEVQEKAMIYNAGRKSMYLNIRKYLNPSITIPVENKGLAMDEPEIDIFS